MRNKLFFTRSFSHWYMLNIVIITITLEFELIHILYLCGGAALAHTRNYYMRRVILLRSRRRRRRRRCTYSLNFNSNKRASTAQYPCIENWYVYAAVAYELGSYGSTASFLQIIHSILFKYFTKQKVLNFSQTQSYMFLKILVFEISLKIVLR